MADWLANPTAQHVGATIIILLLVRLLLARRDTYIARSVAEFVEAALGAVILVFLVIRPFMIQAFYIPSESMLPTLRVRDHILVNKLVYRFREPRYGEIIVFKAPPSASNGKEEVDLIKRVIGKPGDVLEIKNGVVYRNGTPLVEPYLKDGRTDTNMKATTIPRRSVWVMGDNRNNSTDSRAWGPLDERYIIGKAFFRFWPPDRIGLIR
jgi:signal peptidase I